LKGANSPFSYFALRPRGVLVSTGFGLFSGFDATGFATAGFSTAAFLATGFFFVVVFSTTATSSTGVNHLQLK
jgi:hypothetical protein